MKFYNKVTVVVCVLFLLVALLNKGRDQNSVVIEKNIISQINQLPKNRNTKQRNVERGIASERIISEARTYPEIGNKTFAVTMPGYNDLVQMKEVFQVYPKIYMNFNGANYFLSKAKVIPKKEFQSDMGSILSEKKNYFIVMDQTSGENLKTHGKVLINETTLQVSLFFNDGFLELKTIDDVERVKQDLLAMQVKFEYGGTDKSVQIFLTEEMSWKKMESTLKSLPGVVKVYPRFLTHSIQTL